jgi:hypothetical protein
VIEDYVWIVTRAMVMPQGRHRARRRRGRGCGGDQGRGAARGRWRRPGPTHWTSRPRSRVHARRTSALAVTR